MSSNCAVCCPVLASLKFKVAVKMHNTPLSYQRSVATIKGSLHEENIFSSSFSTLTLASWVKPCDWQKILGTKFNCLHEGIIPMLKLTFLSHFLPIQLARCYLDPSFLLFILTLQSISKLQIVPRLCNILVWVFQQPLLANFSVSSAHILLQYFGLLGR